MSSPIAGSSGINDPRNPSQANKGTKAGVSNNPALAKLIQTMRRDAVAERETAGEASSLAYRTDSGHLDYYQGLTFYDLQQAIKKERGVPSKEISQQFASSNKLLKVMLVAGFLAMTFLVVLGYVLKYYQIPSVGSSPSLQLSTKTCHLLRGCGILLGIGTVLTFLGTKSLQTHKIHQRMKLEKVSKEAYVRIILSLPQPYQGTDL